MKMCGVTVYKALQPAFRGWKMYCTCIKNVRMAIILREAYELSRRQIEQEQCMISSSGLWYDISALSYQNLVKELAGKIQSHAIERWRINISVKLREKQHSHGREKDEEIKKGRFAKRMLTETMFRWIIQGNRSRCVRRIFARLFEIRLLRITTRLFNLWRSWSKQKHYVAVLIRLRRKKLQRTTYYYWNQVFVEVHTPECVVQKFMSRKMRRLTLILFHSWSAGCKEQHEAVNATAIQFLFRKISDAFLGWQLATAKQRMYAITESRKRSQSNSRIIRISWRALCAAVAQGRLILQHIKQKSLNGKIKAAWLKGWYELVKAQSEIRYLIILATQKRVLFLCLQVQNKRECTKIQLTHRAFSVWSPSLLQKHKCLQPRNGTLSQIRKATVDRIVNGWWDSVRMRRERNRRAKKIEKIIEILKCTSSFKKWCLRRSLKLRLRRAERQISKNCRKRVLHGTFITCVQTTDDIRKRKVVALRVVRRRCERQLFAAFKTWMKSSKTITYVRYIRIEAAQRTTCTLLSTHLLRWVNTVQNKIGYNTFLVRSAATQADEHPFARLRHYMTVTKRSEQILNCIFKNRIHLILINTLKCWSSYWQLNHPNNKVMRRFLASLGRSKLAHIFMSWFGRTGKLRRLRKAMSKTLQRSMRIILCVWKLSRKEASQSIAAHDTRYRFLRLRHFLESWNLYVGRIHEIKEWNQAQIIRLWQGTGAAALRSWIHIFKSSRSLRLVGRKLQKASCCRSLHRVFGLWASKKPNRQKFTRFLMRSSLRDRGCRLGYAFNDWLLQTTKTSFSSRFAESMAKRKKEILVFTAFQQWTILLRNMQRITLMSYEKAVAHRRSNLRKDFAIWNPFVDAKIYALYMTTIRAQNCLQRIIKLMVYMSWKVRSQADRKRRIFLSRMHNLRCRNLLRGALLNLYNNARALSHQRIRLIAAHRNKSLPLVGVAWCRWHYHSHFCYFHQRTYQAILQRQRHGTLLKAYILWNVLRMNDSWQREAWGLKALLMAKLKSLRSDFADEIKSLKLKAVDLAVDNIGIHCFVAKYDNLLHILELARQRMHKIVQLAVIKCRNKNMNRWLFRSFFMWFRSTAHFRRLQTSLFLLKLRFDVKMCRRHFLVWKKISHRKATRRRLLGRARRAAARRLLLHHLAYLRRGTVGLRRAQICYQKKLDKIAGEWLPKTLGIWVGTTKRKRRLQCIAGIAVRRLQTGVLAWWLGVWAESVVRCREEQRRLQRICDERHRLRCEVRQGGRVGADEEPEKDLSVPAWSAASVVHLA